MTYYNISNNLKTIISLNDAVYAPANVEIDIVFANLSSQDKQDNCVDGFADLFISAMSTLIDIDVPGLPFITMILSGVVNSYTIAPIPPNLLQQFASISERYLATYKLIDTDLTTYMNDPIKYQALTFTLPKGLTLPAPFAGKTTISMNDLSGVQIPEQGTDAFMNYKNAFLTGFQYALARQQVAAVGGYSIGGFEVNDNPEFWYTMAMPPQNADTYTWTYGQYSIDSQDLGMDTAITINGTSMADFDLCAGKFCVQVGGALIIPINRSDTSITYIKMYMLQNFVLEDRSGWNLGSASFYTWLFIDDGFGNTINGQGIAKREEVFRSWNIQYGTQIPPSA